MTGRELIIYILTNHLEDVQIFEDGKIPGCLTVEEAAVKLNVGIETVKILYQLGELKGFTIGDRIYIFATKGE